MFETLISIVDTSNLNICSADTRDLDLVHSDKHSSKVVNFMLDMMCPLITEADAVSQELLDIILKNIIEPCRSQNKHAYSLSKDLLRRTANAIEPYIQTVWYYWQD